MVGPERYHHLRFGACIFFSGVRTPALNDYASRRPSCLLESIERLYQSSFIFYTGPQSHHTEKAGSKGTGMASKVARQEYTLRKIWTRKRARRERSDKGRHCRALRKNSVGVYDSNERETKERAGTLPLALSMFRRNASAHGEVDLLKEVHGSEGQTTVQDAAEEYEIIYSKDDVVALKHNYKRYIILSSSSFKRSPP